MNDTPSTTPHMEKITPAKCEQRHTTDGSDTLYHPIYKQTYHSRHGAITESNHVFIQNSGLPERLQHGNVSILEIGIGTGLNLVLSATQALRNQSRLDYTGIEQCPPAPTALKALNYADSSDVDADLWAQCRQLFDARTPHHNAHPFVHLQLLWQRFETVELPPVHYDIVYHDGFSPDVNAELWTDEALQHIADALRPGGVLVTYSVQGRLRRALAQCGLDVERVPGPPGGKRQVLRALKPPASNDEHRSTAR